MKSGEWKKEIRKVGEGIKAAGIKEGRAGRYESKNRQERRVERKESKVKGNQGESMAGRRECRE